MLLRLRLHVFHLYGECRIIPQFIELSPRDCGTHARIGNEKWCVDSLEVKYYLTISGLQWVRRRRFVVIALCQVTFGPGLKVILVSIGFDRLYSRLRPYFAKPSVNHPVRIPVPDHTPLFPSRQIRGFPVANS